MAVNKGLKNEFKMQSLEPQFDSYEDPTSAIIGKQIVGENGGLDVGEYALIPRVKSFDVTRNTEAYNNETDVAFQNRRKLGAGESSLTTTFLTDEVHELITGIEKDRDGIQVFGYSKDVTELFKIVEFKRNDGFYYVAVFNWSPSLPSSSGTASAAGGNFGEVVLSGPARVDAVKGINEEGEETVYDGYSVAFKSKNELTAAESINEALNRLVRSEVNQSEVPSLYIDSILYEGIEGKEEEEGTP